jgi:hypothetical protein
MPGQDAGLGHERGRAKNRQHTDYDGGDSFHQHFLISDQEKYAGGGHHEFILIGSGDPVKMQDFATFTISEGA